MREAADFQLQLDTWDQYVKHAPADPVEAEAYISSLRYVPQHTADAARLTLSRRAPPLGSWSLLTHGGEAYGGQCIGGPEIGALGVSGLRGQDEPAQGEPSGPPSGEASGEEELLPAAQPGVPQEMPVPREDVLPKLPSTEVELPIPNSMVDEPIPSYRSRVNGLQRAQRGLVDALGLKEPQRMVQLLVRPRAESYSPPNPSTPPRTEVGPRRAGTGLRRPLEKLRPCKKFYVVFF